MLIEAGYKCGSPICRQIITLQIHHIVWVKDGGENTPDNLLALCPNCHSLHTQGYIPEAAIKTWKQLLVSLNDANRGTADLLLVLYNEEKRIEKNEKDSLSSFRFTGDSLPAIASLITSGILEISKRYRGAGHFASTLPSFEVKITEKGNNLVEAWLEGNPRKIKVALSNSKAT